MLGLSSPVGHLWPDCWTFMIYFPKAGGCSLSVPSTFITLPSHAWALWSIICVIFSIYSTRSPAMTCCPLAPPFFLVAPNTIVALKYPLTLDLFPHIHPIKITDISMHVHLSRSSPLFYKLPKGLNLSVVGNVHLIYVMIHPWQVNLRIYTCNVCIPAEIRLFWWAPHIISITGQCIWIVFVFKAYNSV